MTEVKKTLEELTLEELAELLAYKRKQQHQLSGSKKVLFTLTFFLILFGIVEGIASYRKWKKEKKRQKEGAHRVDTPDETHYALKPNSSGVLSGAEFHINSRGFRSPEFDVEKKKTRLVCVGDSLTFGWGATDEETYPFLLGKQLSEIEVINGGVVGYNSKNLIRRLREDILPLKPDLLICLIGWNNLREYVYGNLRPIAKPSHHWTDHFATKWLVQETVKRLDRSLKITYRKGVQQTLQSSQNHREWAFFPDYKNDLIQIKKICEDANIDFLFLSLPHYFGGTLTEKDQFELLNITLGVDLSYQGWEKTIQEMNQIIQEIVGADRFISINSLACQPSDFSDFCHPTPRSNQKIAEFIAPEILKRIKK